MPQSRAQDARAAGREARIAAEQLSREGTQVRYLRTTFVPNDETCFHVFESVGKEAVGEVCRRAGIGSARIVPALE
jgi:hypothetical protein